MWLVATTLESVKRKYKGAHSISTIHTPSSGKANKNYISQMTVSLRFGMQFGHGNECSRATFEGESEAEGIFLLVPSSLFQNHCGCVQVLFCLHSSASWMSEETSLGEIPRSEVIVLERPQNKQGGWLCIALESPLEV